MAKRLIVPGFAEPPQDDERDPDDIDLVTRERNFIKNRQARDKLTQLDRKEVQRLENRFRGAIARRSGPTAMYNCHGLTFACRRTRIYTNDALKLILKDDTYEEVPPDKVMAGDVILYFSEEGDDIEHSGIVVEGSNGGALVAPVVVSKWGSGPKYVHRANMCAYNISNAKYFRIMHKDETD